MTVAVLLSRVIGFLREAFVAKWFGANGGTDAFFAAFTIPDWLNYLVAGGTLSITLLPVYARYLAADDEREANRVLSIVSTIMMVVVGGGVVIGEIFAGPMSAAFFHKLDPAALVECVRYTRILLPAQIFFFAGGLAAATLFARGRFAAAAVAPLIYNGGIIVGGWLLGPSLGPAGLAWGALGGAAIGPFLICAVDAWKHGARVRPSFAARHPGFVEWLKLSLPLMIGVSVVSADDWIIRYFADGVSGAISHLNYAKKLVAVPIAVAGQAVGQASMPFFARLFAEGKRDELADTIARTVRGAGVVAILCAAWMVALAEPIVDLAMRRGHFEPADVGPTATYLVIFAIAVPFWAVQGLTARAFYAARNTMTPMIAGTLITVLSSPLYAAFWSAWGPSGLAVASGLGIFAHTLALFLLVPRMIPELRRVAGGIIRGLTAGLIVAVAAGSAAFAAGHAMARLPIAAGGHLGDVLVGGVGTLAFAIVVGVVAPWLGIDEPRRFAQKIWRKVRPAG